MSSSSSTTDRIVLNVSGTRFETSVDVLERFPGTRLALLATLRKDDESFDRERNEFYFDRHPEVFADILHFYRTEELHIRHNLCGNVIKKEFEFWGMYEQDIEPCCWTSYSQAAECKETLAAIDNTFLTGSRAVEETEVWETEKSAWIRFRRKAWALLEDPSASMTARAMMIGHRVYVFVSMLVVVFSIVCFVSETYESFRVPIAGANKTANAMCTKSCGIYMDPSLEPGLLQYNIDDTEPHPVLVYIDYALFSFFALEFLIRVFFVPSYRKYLKDFLNWIDIICVATHAVSVALNSMENLSYNYTATLVKTVLTLRVLRGLRIVRILRIFKLVKHYNAFKILIYTIKISLRELLLMIVFLFVGAVIFGSVIHVVEKESFRNIPLGLWWALVTMTTVGYGDFAPRQATGYAVGCVCVIFGVLTIAFTVPIVVNNFAMYYSHAQSRNKKPREYWKIKRVPAKELQKPSGLSNALQKFKKVKPPTEEQLYGGEVAVKKPRGRSAAGSLAMSIMLNNLNGEDGKEDAWKSEKAVRPATPESSDFNFDTTLTPRQIGLSLPVGGPKFFARRAPMTPVEEVTEEKRLKDENEERSRQLLAQAEESQQQISEAKEKQAHQLQQRKAAIKKKKMTAKTSKTAGGGSKKSSDEATAASDA